jgi:hypothetical protein
MAHAGLVRGTVSLPPGPRSADLHDGHWRVDNGVLPIGPRVPDPRSEVVVVLEGAKPTARAADAPPPAVNVSLHGVRADPAVVVVPVGASVSFRNDDRVGHTLYLENARALFGPAAQPAGQTRSVRLMAAAEYLLRDEEWPHVQATLVAVETPYFAQADERGNFRLEVPEGRYTLKVFWRGWVLSQPLEVGPKMTDLSLQVPMSVSAEGKRGE